MAGEGCGWPAVRTCTGPRGHRNGPKQETTEQKESKVWLSARWQAEAQSWPSEAGEFDLVCDPRGFAPRFPASSPPSFLSSFVECLRAGVRVCLVSAVDLAPTPRQASQPVRPVASCCIAPRQVTGPTLLGPLPDCPLLQISLYSFLFLEREEKKKPQHRSSFFLSSFCPFCPLAWGRFLPLLPISVFCDDTETGPLRRRLSFPR